MGKRLAFIFFCLSLIVTTALIWALNRPHGVIPPMGRLLDPVSGIWNQPREGKNLPINQEVLAGLTDQVQVRFDEDRIPHIFAANDADAYFVQGYLVARDRLWQMDFLTRLAAGRLSEVVGEKTVETDRYFVKIRLLDAAQKSLEEMKKDSLTKLAVESYTKGVNAFIQNLRPRDWPFEFKVLNYAPEEWTEVKTALLVKFMSHQLAGYSRDVRLSRSFAKLSQADFDDLFEISPSLPEPVIPRGTKWEFNPVPTPAPPAEIFKSAIEMPEPLPTPNPANGSNNWAVMGKKSTTGLPIVSNDIHLDFGLPSLWYVVQIVTPTQNVYGITLPGGPGVILGFNETLAWAVTNGGADVLDWYELKFNEDQTKYFYEGDWKEVSVQEHEIKVRGAPSIKLSLRSTHHGPIIYNQDETPLRGHAKGLAMKWIAHEGTDELGAFLHLNQAKDFQECQQAIFDYVSPNQNFICADNQDNVGLMHRGKYPLKWKGQGRLIADGSRSSHEWAGFIPPEQIPQVINPERGFVSSANQIPFGDTYPYYLGSGFDVPYRGWRINEILSGQEPFSPQDLIKMQMDTLNIEARLVVPKMLKALDLSRLNAKQKKIVELLQEWDFRHELHSVAATFYQEWWRQFEIQTWQPHFPDEIAYSWPRDERLVRMVSEENSKWFDSPQTQEKEVFADVALASFLNADEVLSGEQKESLPAPWRDHQMARFAHLTKIRGLEARVPMAGNEVTILANNKYHGPVWKSVVALGEKKPQAWGIYPGGQSGNPTSRHYDDLLRDWSEGRLHPILFLESATEEHKRLQDLWVYEPGREE